LLVAGLALCLIGLVACLLAPTYGMLVAGFGLLGMGFGFAQPGLVAGTSLAAGDRQAEAAGILQAAMAAAWIVGALTGTAIYGLSIAGPLALAALAILAALLVAAVADPARRTERPDSRSSRPTRLL
jgi:MFS family permease